MKKQPIPAFERNLLQWISRHRAPLFFVAITLIALLIRFSGRGFVSSDMLIYLIPWFDEAKLAGGLPALARQIGDYSLLFQTLTALATYLPIPALYFYKGLSIAFDFCLALAAGTVLAHDSGNRPRAFLAGYTGVLLLPTVFLNSAFWGQCDAIFTFFSVLSLYCLFREKYTAAFVLLGVSFAFKLQTVFILPVFLSVYFTRKSFSAAYFLLSVLVFWLSGAAAYAAGRPLGFAFTIYQYQTTEFNYMYCSSHSFWRLFADEVEYLQTAAIALTLGLLGAGLMQLLSGRKKLDTWETFFNTSAWFVWTALLFLPRMHERYTFLLDILLLLLALKRVRYVGFALVSLILSLITYQNYLFLGTGTNGTPALIGSIINTIAWVIYSVLILREGRQDRP